MDLRCGIRHLWGQKIDVRGSMYDVSQGGLVKDVTDAHAALLMQGAGWSEATGAVAPSRINTDDRRGQLIKLGGPELIRRARDLGISVMGKSAADAADAMIAREDEMDAARRAEDDARAQSEGNEAKDKPDAKDGAGNTSASSEGE